MATLQPLCRTQASSVTLHLLNPSAAHVLRTFSPRRTNVFMFLILKQGVSAARSVSRRHQQRAPGGRPGHTLLDISAYSAPTTQSEIEPSNR